MNRHYFPIIACCCLGLTLARVSSAETPSAKTWPRRIEVPQGTIVIYQPQIEMFNGVELKCRAAIAVTPRDEPQPSYGATWIQAHLITDRDQRLARIHSIKVLQSKFTGSTVAQETKLKEFLENEIPKWELTISLDRLLLGMEATTQQLMSESQLSKNVPGILISEEPAILVTITGPAKVQTIQGTSIKRVVNSPYQIFYDSVADQYFLNGGKHWFAAREIKANWSVADKAPANLTRLYPPASSQPASDEPAPRVIVKSEPSELIVFDGKPKFQSIPGADLSFAANTDNDVFMDSNGQAIYVLLAGRWFHGDSMNGPWSAVIPGGLPSNFKLIPADSPKARVLAHVPGTAGADAAVRDAQIPQTAVIRRSEPVLRVTYDGAPKFTKIEGHDVSYAENSPYAVIQNNGKFYCCQFAIWYESENAEGPWRICDSVPEAIYDIPPTCPYYNVKFARVYSNTADEVYVGYTPGYVGSYIANGTVVYGTGFPYEDWFDKEYISRPITWGLNARYDAVHGDWKLFADYVSPKGNYNITPGSLDGGENRVRRWLMAGWWGAGGYRDYADMRGAGTVERPRKRNIYDIYKQANTIVSVQKPAGVSGTRTAMVAEAAAGKGNDMFVDRTGTVYRRTANGWEKREVADWIQTRLGNAPEQAELSDESRKREEAERREKQSDAIPGIR